MKKPKTQTIDNLYQAILKLENLPEAQAFFRDLLTKTEIEEFATRFQIAQMLDQGITYTEIETKTGISSTTIARISKWLKTGKGGYQLIIDRLK